MGLARHPVSLGCRAGGGVAYAVGVGVAVGVSVGVAVGVAVFFAFRVWPWNSTRTLPPNGLPSLVTCVLPPDVRPLAVLVPPTVSVSSLVFPSAVTRTIRAPMFWSFAARR